MWRTIASILAGFVVWVVAVTKVARLAIGAISSLAAGAVVRSIAPANRLAPWFLGLVMLALFVPDHIHLWSRFPIWYHLTFLITLAPLVALSALFVPHAKADPGTRST